MNKITSMFKGLKAHSLGILSHKRNLLYNTKPLVLLYKCGPNIYTL